MNNINQIKEISLVSNYNSDDKNKVSYKDLLRASSHWISYKREYKDGTKKEWSYKSSDWLVDIMGSAPHLENIISQLCNQKETDSDSPYSFNLRVTYSDGTHKDLFRHGTFRSNNISDYAMPFLQSIPLKEIYPDVLSVEESDNKKENKVIELIGDALDNDCDVLCHQVNLEGYMGGGIAYQIAKTYPSAEKEYMDYSPKKLGEVCFAKTDKYVVSNCFSQDESYNTDYESLKECLDKVVTYLKDNHLHSVAIPDHYGCGIANGDWYTVKGIFEDKLKDFTLKIYKLQR